MTAWVCARACAGLACGVLLALVGLELWGTRTTAPGLPRAIWAVRWLAAALSLTSVLFAWRAERAPFTYSARLISMAAMVILPGARPSALRTWPGGAAAAICALILAGIGAASGFEPPAVGNVPPVIGWVAIACGGLGARLLAEWVSAAVVRDWEARGEQASIPYALLTALVGGAALLNLWRQGAVWGGTSVESSLAGAWLIWSAGRLTPSRPVWLRAALVIGAGVLLIMAALV